MTPLTSSSSTVLVLGLTSEKRSLMDLRTLADWTLRLRLLAVPGVSKVAVFGGDVRSIQVQVHPDQLIRYNLSFNDVLEAAKKATAVTGAGFIETANQRIVFQSEGQSIEPDDIAHTVVATSGGASVLLKDVADVVNAAEPPIGGAAVMGKPGVVLLVSGQLGANTIDVTDGVEEALDDLKPLIAKEHVEMRTDLFRPADFIAISTSNVRNSLLLGGALVVVVLCLFLFDLRTATISCMAIPLSLLGGDRGAQCARRHAQCHDARRPCHRHRRGGGRRGDRRGEHCPPPAPQPALAASAAHEPGDPQRLARGARRRRLRDLRRHPRVRAGGDAAGACRPLLCAAGPRLRSRHPRLARGGAYRHAGAVRAAVPAASPWRRRSPRARIAEDPPVTRWMRRYYEALLRKIVARPRTTMVAALAFTLIGCAALPFFGAEFLPELKEGHFTLHMAAVPGTSIEESQRIGALVTKALLKLPLVHVVSQRIGRAEKADDTWGTHYSEFEVDLKRNLSGAEFG